MKQWFTAAELAGLPGLPKTSRAILLKAEKYGWSSQPRAKGKGQEYAFTNLPVETQSYLMGQASSPASLDIKQMQRSQNSELGQQTCNGLQELAAVMHLPEHKQELVKAKIVIFKTMAASVLTLSRQRKKIDSESNFVHAYNRKELPLEAWVYQNIPSISRLTVLRWSEIYQSEGVEGLAGRYKNSKESKIESFPELVEFILALVTAKPHFLTKHKEVANLIGVKRQESFPSWPTVSASGVHRYLAKLKKSRMAELAYTTNPRQFNNSHRPLFGTMYPWVSAPNEVWELDSTPTDIQLNANGKARRYSIIGAIDVFTRRLKVVLMPSSNSEGICLLLRKCLLEWGIPAPDSLIRTDNGSDYVSKTTTTIFSMLDLKQSKATAFSGWEKPFIERAFKTLSHGLMEKLPAYVGHNVADKKRLQDMQSFAESIGAKRKERDQQLLDLSLTPTELQSMLDDWLEFDYHHKPHAGLDNQTPFQVYTASGYRPQVPENPHSLDLLLNYVGTSTVIRGRVSAGSIKYTAPELMESLWDRRTVKVFLDPSDVGRATLYPTDSWEQCVEAVNMDLIGREIDPAMFRDRRKEATKTLRDFKKTADRLQQQYGIGDLAAVELAQKKLANQSLTGFNPTEIDYSNSALSALSKTATNLISKTAEPSYSEAELQAIAARRTELDRRREVLSEQNSKVLRTEHQQAEYLTRESMIRPLTEAEATWLRSFRNSHLMTRKRLDRILEESKRAIG